MKTNETLEMNWCDKSPACECPACYLAYLFAREPEMNWRNKTDAPYPGKKVPYRAFNSRK